MKIVAISDSHGSHKSLTIPDGDVLVVAGDFMRHGGLEEIPVFHEWLTTLPHKKKIIVAGNHDWAFERTPSMALSLLYAGTIGDIHYLGDRSFTFEGVKFYGSPWQPDFFNWAFNLPRGEQLARVWARIPSDIDVLITHGPPAGIMDRNAQDKKFGCQDLLERVLKIKPPIHIFGHAHAGYGNEEHDGIRYYNVAVSDERYFIANPPTEIDYEEKQC